MDSQSAGSPVWFKSNRCESNQCVEIAYIGDDAAMRNSTAPDVKIIFPAGTWAAFVADIRAGRFDGPARS